MKPKLHTESDLVIELSRLRREAAKSQERLSKYRFDMKAMEAKYNDLCAVIEFYSQVFGPLPNRYSRSSDPGSTDPNRSAPG